MVEVRILKVVGPYLPDQVVKVDTETAVHLCDGVRAMLQSDFQKMQLRLKDPSNLTVKEMNEMNMKNVPQDENALKHAAIEQAAVDGKPVASGEPLVPTGGVTPPTMVFPAMAEAGKHEVTKPGDLKVKKADKKDDEKKPESKKDDKK